MNNDESIKCICCDKEQEVLVSVEMKSNSIFLHRRGVCQSCLKTEDINKVCEEFEIRKQTESIKEMESSLESMKDNLSRLCGSTSCNCGENESCSDCPEKKDAVGGLNE